MEETYRAVGMSRGGRRQERKHNEAAIKYGSRKSREARQASVHKVCVHVTEPRWWRAAQKGIQTGSKSVYGSRPRFAIFHRFIKEDVDVIRVRQKGGIRKYKEEEKNPRKEARKR